MDPFYLFNVKFNVLIKKSRVEKVKKRDVGPGFKTAFMALQCTSELMAKKERTKK